jgi:hypothetical protein
MPRRKFYDRKRRQIINPVDPPREPHIGPRPVIDAEHLARAPKCLASQWEREKVRTLHVSM